MTNYIALLRAVNVGGTGKLPMSDLKNMCEDIGFENVKTYIASGNVVFSSSLDEQAVRQQLNNALEAYAGKFVGVFVRTGEQMASVLAANPFIDLKPNFTVAIFLNDPPLPNTLDDLAGKQGEQCILGEREIYVHYPNGMGRSKLKIPSGKNGTARNMNTISKLVQLANELPAVS